MTDDSTFLTTAIDLAARSAETGGGPFGAVVVTATGGLYPAHNTVTATHDPTAHAEVNALRAAGAGEGTNDLTGAVLYSSSEPCPMCLAAALWARIDRLVYAATIEDAATAGFDDSSFYRQLREGVTDLELVHDNHPHRLRPFTAWLANTHRTDY